MSNDQLAAKNEILEEKVFCECGAELTDGNFIMIDGGIYCCRCASQITSPELKVQGPKSADPEPDQSMIEAERTLKMCLGKKAYYRVESAEKAAEDVKLSRGVDLRIYSCPICGHFHLTKKVDNGHDRHLQ